MCLALLAVELLPVVWSAALVRGTISRWQFENSIMECSKFYGEQLHVSQIK